MNRHDEPLSTVNIEARIKHDTPDAYLLVVEGEDYWVPRSQCSDKRDGTFDIAEWFAKRKGMI